MPDIHPVHPEDPLGAPGLVPPHQVGDEVQPTLDLGDVLRYRDSRRGGLVVPLCMWLRIRMGMDQVKSLPRLGFLTFGDPATGLRFCARWPFTRRPSSQPRCQGGVTVGPWSDGLAQNLRR